MLMGDQHITEIGPTHTPFELSVNIWTIDPTPTIFNSSSSQLYNVKEVPSTNDLLGAGAGSNKISMLKTAG